METVADTLMRMREQVAEEGEGVSVGADYVSEGAWRSHDGCT